MGWVSTLTSAFKGLGNSIGGSLSLQDATGGWSTYSATQSLRKDQMRRELKQMELAAKQGPSWTMAGLKEAGINPILAADSINSWSGQHGSLGTQANSGGSSLGFKSKMDRNMVQEQTKNIESDTELKKDQGDAALMQANAAQINALNSAKKTEAEIKLIDQQRKKLSTATPGESGWGTTDAILGSAGDIGTSLGGTAIATKAIYDAVKKPKNKIIKTKDVHGNTISAVEYPSGLVLPKTLVDKSTPRSTHSSKAITPILTNPYSLGIGYGILGIGAGYEAFKRTNHKDNEYNKSQRWYSHGNWSR